MHMRHRIPVIFSLSMLDMLCCALGAVIFLMILNMWDAGRQAKVLAMERKRVSEAAQRLDDSQSDLKDSQANLNSTHDDLKQLQAKLRSMDEEAEKSKTRLADAEHKWEESEKSAADKEKERANLAASVEAMKKDLAEHQRAAKDARERLEEAEKQRADAAQSAALVPGLQKELAEATKRAQDLQAELKKLTKAADESGAQTAETQKQAQTVQAEIVSLRKQLDEQKTAVGRVRQQLTAAEGRFAGVDLRGKRVVCLVDMSGSMGSVDAKTLDPNKWPEVRRTVVQVLKSLPDVTHFQVIVFSSETQFLLGKPGEWMSFDREISPEAVGQALARVQPNGDTNLYAAFEAAFRFRPQGLDTIFLFSDGLPNVGPGLPAQPPKDEYVQSTMLSNHLRQTIRTRWNAPDASQATQARGQPEAPVRIHAVGFFYESPNLGAFLWALARENGGSFVGMSKP
jgi:chemotaxis protein histidine kinase CheA